MKSFGSISTTLVLSLLTAPAWAETATPEMLAGTCVSCHGPEGSSVGPASPSIAGMSANYFTAAMLAFKYDDDEDKLEKVIDADADLEDVEALPRTSTIMGRLAKGYTEEEIKVLAEYFAAKEMKRPDQEVDPALVKAGEKRHEKYCDKCHEDAGRVAEDDTGVLAGQWMHYFEFAMEDFISGERAMPKKMKKQLDKMNKKYGEKALEELNHFYASQK